MSPALDPAAALVLRAALALLFVASAVHKLRDRPAFRAILERYQLIPSRWTSPAAAAVAVLEAAIGAAMLFTSLAAFAAALLLALYAGAIAVNLVRGRRDIDCGCAGPASRLPLAWSLVARNLVLIAAALLAALPNGPRPLLWIDAVSVPAAVLFLALIYSAAETALANAARGARLVRAATAQENA